MTIGKIIIYELKKAKKNKKMINWQNQASSEASKVNDSIEVC